MGAKFVTFPKFQTSASQTETLFPLSPPLPPFPHSYSVGAKTPSPPATKPQPPPSSTPSRPIHRRPPPSRRSRYPDVVVQRNRNRNALKDLAAEAEAELPPRRRRRRVPYQNHCDHAVL